MNAALENALTRQPVTVTLDGKEYALAYPVEAVMLYKEETGKLDRARAAIKLAAGIKPLTRAEKKDLRQSRKAILKEWPAKPLDEWTADDVEETELLLREATAITCQLDEDAGTGDNLYLVRNWRKIGSDDFDRLLLAIWVGLHTHSCQSSVVSSQLKQSYSSPLSLAELGQLQLTDTELTAVVEAINAALSRSLIARKDPDDEEPVPNALPAIATTTMPAPTEIRIVEKTETDPTLVPI